MNTRLKKGFLVGAGALAVFMMNACSKHESGDSAKGARTLPTVEVAVAESVGAEIPVRVVVTGVVRASERASVAPKVMGTIRSLPVDLGQSVKAGDLLVKIEAVEISAKVLQAQAQLTQAQRDLARERSLLEKGASTSEMVKNLTDRAAIMEAMLQEAEAMLSYTEIRAPFDGTVSQIFSDEGSLSAPGMPLLELQGMGGFEVEASIPESMVGDLEIGSTYEVSLPASEGRFEAVLKEVSSGFDVSSRTVAARFSLPEGAPTRAGQFAKLEVLSKARSAIVVPERAVSQVGQMERIFVAKNGVSELRLVKTGARFDGQVEVVAGLDAGESVVVESKSALVDGQPLSLAR